MNKETIIKYLKKSLKELYEKDKALFTMKVHERTICSQLACYMKPYFTGYNVDCEYNRNMWNTKKCGGFNENYPDILIHRRFENNENIWDENNLVYIETKTSWFVNESTKKDDIANIKCFMTNSPYKYKFWLFLCFGKSFQSLEWNFYFKDKNDEVLECEF